MAAGPQLRVVTVPVSCAPDGANSPSGAASPSSRRCGSGLKMSSNTAFRVVTWCMRSEYDGRDRTFNGHQNHGPRMAAIDGVISERTISVSSSSPIPMVIPPWPTLSRSPEIMAPIVNANTSPAAVTTVPVLPIERMIPVLIPAPISSLNRDTSSRL